MASTYYVPLTLTPLSSTPNKCVHKLSPFTNGAAPRFFTTVKFSGLCRFPGAAGKKPCWDYGERLNLSAFSASNGNWVGEDDEFVVVNFYRFVCVENPQEEVSKHLSFMQLLFFVFCKSPFERLIVRIVEKDFKVGYRLMTVSLSTIGKRIDSVSCNTFFHAALNDAYDGRDIHGRIYLNEQGINAQYSGPSKDALAYVEWVKEDKRFSDILVQISPAIKRHAFPKLKLRYKPSLVQLEEGTSHLPLVDPSMRATPLTPSEWRDKLDVVNKIDNSLSTKSILLDVRNGYEWDVGHFQGAQRPNVDSFRSTSFGLSEAETEVIASDPLATVDKENTDILMYCTGGIRCDVYSTILRQQGFKRLYTLKGGISHYLENEGSTGWVGNLFVFDSRLSLPPATYKPAEASGNKLEAASHSFAKCYICGSQVSELRHRNCANIDCNLLFLCCLKCVDDFRGCCCMKCTSAARLRPVLTGHQRYQKWHNYRDIESKNRSELNPVS